MAKHTPGPFRMPSSLTAKRDPYVFSTPASLLAGEEAWGMIGESLFTRRMNRRGPVFCCYAFWLLSLCTCRTRRQGALRQPQLCTRDRACPAGEKDRQPGRARRKKLRQAGGECRPTGLSSRFACLRASMWQIPGCQSPAPARRAGRGAASRCVRHRIASVALHLPAAMLCPVLGRG
jgi:hypothetical protein